MNHRVPANLKAGGKKLWKAVTDEYVMKECTKCRELKPLEQFRMMSVARDGRRPDCKTCCAAREREHREKNRESLNARDRAYYAANRDKAAAYRDANRDRRNANHRAWYEANQDHARRYSRDYYTENRGQAIEYAREYAAENPHIGWESKYRVRAKKFGFVPVVESFTRADLVDAHGDSCAHCGGPFEHLDHYPVAVALGGPHTLENCRPSCAACNIREGATVREMRHIQEVTA